jgi:D-xylose transport system ATP-binding protein
MTSAPNTDLAPVVQLQSVSKSFGGVSAVKGVTLELRAGEVVGVLGHNGAGKSTLMKILSGAIERDTGEILIDGEPVRLSSPREARDLGIEAIHQDLALADNLSAIDNLFLGREVTQLGLWRNEKAMAKTAENALHRVNPRFKNIKDPVGSLSGGQRQSVAIARALHFNARVLIMDEPTAALGPKETAAFTGLVSRLTDQGVGVFLISHDIHEVFELTDRLVVMADGRIVGARVTAEATKEEVLAMIILGADPNADALKELDEFLA